jgi:hypothetical protein
MRCSIICRLLSAVGSVAWLSFYDAVLAPLGFKHCMNIAKAAAYTLEDRSMFWIGYGEEPFTKVNPSEEFHFAFQAENRKTVDEFYTNAISAGTKDNGKPGLRPHYQAN